MSLWRHKDNPPKTAQVVPTSFENYRRAIGLDSSAADVKFYKIRQKFLKQNFKNLLHSVSYWHIKKERIVLHEIHLRTTGRHLSMGSHSAICHPTKVTAPPSPQPDRLVLDLSTP